jgi:hypothetical protein
VLCRSQQARIIETLFCLSRMTQNKSYMEPDFSFISGHARRK